MARKILNRRELRKESDQAEAQNEKAGEAPAKKTKSKAKADGTPKVKKPRKKKEPPRYVAKWAVYDAGMKQIALFDYNKRDDAEQKIVDLKAKKNTTYFIQMVKEPMVVATEAEPAEK
jgi:hypothetical protein